METTTTAVATLYQRLGGRPRIETIVNDVVANHLANPVIAPRFAALDAERLAKLKGHALDFFCMGSGGSEQYAGRDMRTAHKGMNINEQEFVAALDDILGALDKNGVAQQEKHEVLAILYSLKGDVVRV
jgi:hemoglobin